MPYAPLLAFSARWFQPLSRSHSLFRQPNWSILKPASSISAQPVFRLPENSEHELGIGPSYGLLAAFFFSSAALTAAASSAAFFSAAAFFSIAFFSRVRALLAAALASAAALAAASPVA